jgi:hypothetical protein
MKKDKSIIKKKDKCKIPDKSKINKQLAGEIKEFLPHVTDEVHMKVALALNCEYKVVKAYLAGNIEDEAVARQLIRNLGAIITQGYDSFGAEVDAQDAGFEFIHVADSVMNTFKLCNSNSIRLTNIENRIVTNFTNLEAVLKEISRKVDQATAANN